MCYCNDYERPAIYEEYTRQARKEHKCCECGRKILPGQRYEVATGLWDGSWDEYKTCMMCKALWELMDCRMFGGLFDCLHEEDLYNKFIVFDSNDEDLAKEQYEEDNTGSSNGRTADFDSANVGSSPAPVATGVT